MSFNVKTFLLFPEIVPFFTIGFAELKLTLSSGSVITISVSEMLRPAVFNSYSKRSERSPENFRF